AVRCDRAAPAGLLAPSHAGCLRGGGPDATDALAHAPGSRVVHPGRPGVAVGLCHRTPSDDRPCSTAPRGAAPVLGGGGRQRSDRIRAEGGDGGRRRRVARAPSRSAVTTPARGASRAPADPVPAPPPGTPASQARLP